jgi:alpha-galactosidase
MDFTWNLEFSAISFPIFTFLLKSKSMKRILILSAVALAFYSCSLIPPKKIYLEELDFSKMETGWGTVRAKLSCDSNLLTVAGKVYDHGVGTHAISKMMIDLCGDTNSRRDAKFCVSTNEKSCVSGAVKFHAQVGVDDESANAMASIEFFILGDGRILWQSGLMKMGDPAKKVEISLKGIKKLALYISDGGDCNYYDHADWLEACIEYRGKTPVAVGLPVIEPYILTPPVSDMPRINGPSVTGAGPGKPFLYKIPVTGKKPISYTVDKLPKGLQLDPGTGIISGKAPAKGEYLINITVANEFGEARREFTIITGQGLALTPPLGWNSWNCWGLSVDDVKVRAAADAFIRSGLADHGWTFINIDDGWEAAQRTAEGELLTNEKFPDMKSTVDYVHEKGLKMGIYSSPGPLTCGGYLGSYEHEKQDVETWAGWGIDYVKYDWCSYGKIALSDSLDELQKPYSLMKGFIADARRDIIYSLCQYGMGDVWEWGKDVGGNLWRTTGDITDTWESMAGIGFDQDKCSPYASPGHWNDPDMLVVGQVGWGPNLHPSKLTPDEQYTHISLWCLLSSPLLIGCDLSLLDPFTLNLLTNDEVLAINQDELGQQASRIKKEDGIEIWSKPLADGGLAIGFFNTGRQSPVDAFNWEEIVAK